MKLLVFILIFFSVGAHAESLKLGPDVSDGVVFESSSEVLVTDKGKDIKISVKPIKEEITNFVDFISLVYQSLPSWYVKGAEDSIDMDDCIFKINDRDLGFFISSWYWHHHLKVNSVVINELTSIGIPVTLQENFMMFSICQRIKSGENLSFNEYKSRYKKLIYVDLGVDIIP